MDNTQLVILLIDDNQADVAVTLDALDRHDLGTGVRVARGGHEALDYLCGHGQFESRRRFPLPDLILLDVNMPAVDGYAVLERIREEDSLCRIPVTLLCMSESERKRAIEYRARANHFLVKPVTADSVQDLVQLYENWTLRLDLPARERRNPLTSGSR